MKTNYIQYEDYIRRSQHMNNLKEMGFKFVFKINRAKIVLGAVFLVVAILPNGTAFFMLPMAFMCLGIRRTDLYLYKERGLRIFKLKLRASLK